MNVSSMFKINIEKSFEEMCRVKSNKKKQNKMIFIVVKMFWDFSVLLLWLRLNYSVLDTGVESEGTDPH